MHHTPTFEEFRSNQFHSKLIPVFRKLYSDTLTPVTAFCKANWSREAFLFESVVGGEKVGRYSFLGGNPFLRLEAYGNDIELTQDGVTERKTVSDPLATLAEMIENYPSEHHHGLPRFVGGAVGYAGYDVVRYCEDLPSPPEDDRQLPDLSFAFYESMIIFDHIEKTIIVVAHARTDTDDLKSEYEQACSRVDELCQRLQQPLATLAVPDVISKVDPVSNWSSNFSEDEYCDAVEKCKSYIRAGDIFQVVLSQRLELETSVAPLDVYRALRVVNPSPFMFLLQTPKTTLVGSSPEIMVRVEDRETTIRPLAGTRKRGETEAEDQALAEELVADPKERAEHVMLVDLARNDVGRIADYGTVSLSDVMVVERYSHVMHITSNVKGHLRDGLTSLDALRAGLPAGTVSGAPKVRAMEIIDELERHRRGPYAGAVGYIDFTGNMDTCIALRTLVMTGNKAYVQAGAGIVADSVPEAEYQETLNKARGLLTAIALAEAIQESEA
ncbi:Anthranilate synthase component 1 [Thalassoglobus neptunius]|uniref:Anthranilate synthase component 1 n=1 Tax=Thalassoglobus neptunius TaxID=1938619 RepID=A0A5C5WBF8_9PLAN|nr:Anthranilate synthase component 1 [Thalassoglobus neptunius]